LIGLLVAAVALRAVRLDQPIVENYVGRQIPTAMVARNLDRGSGFLHPTLDTAPFPSYFLVEPPIFAGAAVVCHRLTGLKLEPAGRLVSALAIALGGWGLFGLARRREGPAVALVAVASFALLPITIRYGRAFQPDALMLGCLLAGLRCWDEHQARRSAGWLVAGWLFLATGLAQKITGAYIVVPLIGAILGDMPGRAARFPPPLWRRVAMGGRVTSDASQALPLQPASTRGAVGEGSSTRAEGEPRANTRTATPGLVRGGKTALALASLAPALLWYGHAHHLMKQGIGTAATVETASAWLRALAPMALLRPETYAHVGRFLIVRAFTPLGFVLAVWGLWRTRNRLWPVWAGSAIVALGLLAGKLHHEYYFLALAPLAALGIARGLVDWAVLGRWVAGAAGCGLVALSVLMSASTWRTPPEWAHLAAAAAVVREHVPPASPLIAPEALLYMADRRGYRLEFAPEAAARAARECGVERPVAFFRHPLALVDAYERAAYVADINPDALSPERLALHRALREDPGRPVVVDQPGLVLLADRRRVQATPSD
jgi:hypothetical protein